jgi:hypothetical protein
MVDMATAAEAGVNSSSLQATTQPVREAGYASESHLERIHEATDDSSEYDSDFMASFVHGRPLQRRPKSSSLPMSKELIPRRIGEERASRSSKQSGSTPLSLPVRAPVPTQTSTAPTRRVAASTRTLRSTSQ